MKYNNIKSYNKYIGENNDVIGISLKKNAYESLHGSYSLFHLAKEYDIKLTEPRQIFDSCSKKLMYNYFKKIQKHLKFPCFVYEYKEGLCAIQQIQQIQPRSKNFTKSILPSFEFLSIVAENDLDLGNIIKFALLTSMGISQNSCSHYKAEGCKITVISNIYKPEIEIERVRIKINGETDTIFDIKINGVCAKLQLRSKGSLPQFIYIKTRDKLKGITIKNIKL
jgi:hypothetical protein